MHAPIGAPISIAFLVTISQLSGNTAVPIGEVAPIFVFVASLVWWLSRKLQKLEDGQEKNTEALKKIQDEMGRLPCSKCEDDPPSN